MTYRILYVQHFSGLAGSTLSLLYMIEQLDRNKFTPEVLFTADEGSAVTLYRERGILVHVRPNISYYSHARNGWLPLWSLRPWRAFTLAAKILPSAQRMRQFLAEHRFDLVHINTSVQIPAGIGAKWANIPVIWHIREPLHPGNMGIRRFLIREIIDSCAQAIIAISEFDAAPLKPGPKIHVVYNFVDFQKFNRNLSGLSFRNELGIPEGRPLVGMLGGVVHSKGADIFIEAAIQVRKVHPEVLFLIAGIPPSGESPVSWKRTLRRYIEKLGRLPNIEKRAQDLITANNLEDSVRFVGMRQDVPEMLSALQVLVWPASISHFARPIIEAGVMARPVIASDFPSSREVVKHAETGLLVPPNNPQELAKAILYLVENPTVAQRMGEAGYQIACQHYDARQNAASIFAIYDEVLDRRSVQ